jgi:hypothetical protein
MTETQAKSGAAGAATEPTHASALPVTDTPGSLGAPTAGRGDDKSVGDTSSHTIVRRSTSSSSRSTSPATPAGRSASAG